jgi:nicotinate-nucleotide adenylyltransferase
VISLERVDISSTEIRQKVKNGDSIKGLVPALVEEFIYLHKIYKE